MAERPLTVEMAAEHLGCSPGLVRSMIAKGELRHFRIGRLIRIPASALGDLECASSDSETASTPIGEKMDNPGERRSELRIVKLPSDG